MADKTNRLTIYLVKPEFTDFDDIVDPDTTDIEIPHIGTFYMEDSNLRRPAWIKSFFKDTLDNEDLHLITSTAKGVLLVRVPDDDGTQILAVTFGHGRHLLSDGVIEENFGLKVVLNSVMPDSWRSLDKVSLGSTAKQTREQMSREGAVANFGLDIEQDLVRSVTGQSRLKEFGRTISGKDAFCASAKFDIKDVADMLSTCVKQYKSDTYKQEFDWIDQIQEIRNPKKIDALNILLVSRIQNQELDRVWMSPPEIVDWADIKGFRYGKQKTGELHADLAVADMVASGGTQEIALDWLKARKVFLLSAKSDDIVADWSFYKCLYAEVEHEGTLHILNNGKWYEIAVDFTSRINKSFDGIPDAKIDCVAYEHEHEGEYNKALSDTIPGSCCLDQDLIYHGGGKSSIEFCDVFTAENKLIHVKRYSGSAQLSHLFMQGVVSAELFVSDAEFRAKLNEKLPDERKLADVQQRPNPEKYEVVFAIISRSTKPLDIPFFSKVSLRNAYRRLQGYGFRVSKQKIATQAALIAA
jgi:uncharacterized protein (TIGR04141 family)